MKKHFQKGLAFLLTVLLLIGTVNFVFAEESKNISVLLNGSPLTFDQPPHYYQR